MIYRDLVKKAVYVAMDCHRWEMDKGGYPYIMHPMHLAEQMNDEDSTVVALLHDVVEDSDTTFEDLVRYGFTETQIEAIRALTHKEGQDYMDYIRQQVKPNPIAKKVKLADLAHNLDYSRLGTLTDKDLKRMEKYKTAMKILLDLEE